jgi:hypothetical protein
MRPGPQPKPFWTQVHFGPSCWEWMGRIERTGYGRLRFNSEMYSAHRAAWVLENGAIPDGIMVMHRCDNRKCVRPDHLFLGTHADNMKDMTDKGRQAKGIDHPNKLKTHCPRGHEYTPENTYSYGNRRVCKTCALRRPRWTKTKSSQR